MSEQEPKSKVRKKCYNISMQKIKLFVTGENTTLKHSFLAHFGQSFVIQYGEKNYLFDVGEFSYAIENNLEKLNFTLDKINEIIISHAHFDHVAGLMKLSKKLKNQKIFLPEPLFEEKLVEKQLKRYQVKLDLTDYNAYPNKVLLNQPLQLEKNLYLTGPIIGGEITEQSVVIDLKEKGLAIIIGCAHPGLENIVNKAKEITRNNKIYALIGGLHFIDFSDNEIQQKIDYLKTLNLKFIIPMHCVGFKATVAMMQALKEKVIISQIGSIGVGNSIELSPELNFNIERQYFT